MRRVSLVLILLAMFLMTNCIAPGFRIAKQKIADPRTKAEEGFNPLGFEEDRKILTQQEYQKKSEADEKEKENQTSIEPDSSKDTLNQYKTVYRVQVFASKIPGEVTFFADSIKSALDTMKVYVEYQVPYYRVRIGDYTSFDLAEELLNRLKQMGFGQALVVKSRVRVENEGN